MQPAPRSVRPAEGGAQLLSLYGVRPLHAKAPVHALSCCVDRGCGTEFTYLRNCRVVPITMGYYVCFPGTVVHQGHLTTLSEHFIRSDRSAAPRCQSMERSRSVSSPIFSSDALAGVAGADLFKPVTGLEHFLRMDFHCRPPAPGSHPGAGESPACGAEQSACRPSPPASNAAPMLKLPGRRKSCSRAGLINCVRCRK